MFFCFCFSFSFWLCMIPFIFKFLNFVWRFFFSPSCGVLECSIEHRGACPFFFEHETLCICAYSHSAPREKKVTYIVLVLWRLMLFTYFTSFGVHNALRNAMVSFYLCIFVFRFPFICVWFFSFVIFLLFLEVLFFPILWGFGMFNWAQRCVSIFFRARNFVYLFLLSFCS